MLVTLSKLQLNLKMKLIKTLKKTKKKSAAMPLAMSEKPPVMNQALPPAAKPAPVALESKPIAAKTTAVPPQPKLDLPARSITPRTAAPAPTTTIEASIDVGFGNHLFVRGQGAGLSWERGTPLACVDGQTWRWSAPTSENLTFKLLLNDKVWAQGEDIVVTPGKSIGVAPRF